MSDWAHLLAACALGAAAILLTIGVVADVYRRERNRRLPAPDRHAVVPNVREPL